MLIDRDEYTLSQITEEGYFNETSVMDRSTDFNLAFGIYSNSANRQLVFDETYGTLSVVWTQKFKNKAAKTSILKTRSCNERDFRLEGEDGDSETAFFPLTN